VSCGRDLTGSVRPGALPCGLLALILLALVGSSSCREGPSNTVCLMGDAAGPPLVTPAAQLGGLSCATDATPNATLSSIPFQIDTGGNFGGQPASDFVGGDYGQPSCPDQFLVEMDLSASNSTGNAVFLTGEWSVLTPGAPCGYTTTITIWGYDGSNWTRFDQLVTRGQAEPPIDGGAFCHQVVTSREIQTTLGGTWIPAGTFATARMAVVASDCGEKLPVDIVAEE